MTAKSKKLFLISILLAVFAGAASAQSINPANDSTLFHSFDDFETGDSTVADDSPNDNAGDVNGNPENVSGILNTAISMDGAGDDYVKTSTPDFDNTGAFGGWVYTSDTSGTQYLISNSESANDDDERRYIQVEDGGVQVGLGSTFDSPFGEVPEDEWVHILVTFDNGDYTTYINGADVKSDTYSGDVAGSYDAFIGSDAPTYDQYYLDGDVDEVVAFNESLNSSEVDSLYNLDYASGKVELDNPNPGDGATGVSKDTELSIDYSNSDDQSGNVTFYWENGTEIYEETSVSSGSTVTTDFLDLQEDKEYNWYVEAESDGNTVSEGNYSFTTLSEINPSEDAELFYSYDDFTSGDSVIPDDSPNDFEGDVNGDVQDSTGKLGDAISLGGDDYVNRGSNDVQTGDNSFTVSTWVKTDELTTDSDETVIAFGSPNAGEGFHLYWSGTIDEGWRSGFWSGGNYEGFSPGIDDGEWHHLVTTWDAESGEMDVYVDNNKSIDGFSPGDNIDLGTDTFEVGRWLDGDERHWDGDIDETMIFDQTLTSDEVDSLYNLDYEPQDNIVFTDIFPENDETNLENDSTNLNATVNDKDSDTLDWVSITWNENDTVLTNQTDVQNNSEISTSVSDLDGKETYEWTVEASDGENQTSETYSFDTGFIKDGAYSFAVLPDTQYYSKDYPDVFTNQTEFIASHSDYFEYTIHVGDWVNHPETSQLDNANSSMQKLNDAGVPYSGVPGNHDYETESAPTDRDLTGYLDYFGLDTGTVSHDGDYQDDASSYYDLFNVSHGGETEEFMVLNTELCPRDDTLEWANETVTNHPDKKVIYNNHYLLRPQDDLSGLDKFSNTEDPEDYSCPEWDIGGNTGLEQWNKFIKWHENIFAATAGHEVVPNEKGGDGEALLSREGVNNNTVHVMLSDYQFEDNGGNGWLRAWHFYPDQDKLEVETYSPYLEEYNFTQDDSLEGVEDTNEGMFTLDVDLEEYEAEEPDPSVSIDSPVDGQTYDADSVDLNVTSDEPVNTWEYSLDGASNVSFTPNTTLTNLSDNEHTLNVYATDSDGNTGSESVTFTIDTTPDDDAPTVSLDLNATEIFVNESVEASVSASDDNQVDLVELDWNGDGTYTESNSSASLTAVKQFNETGIYEVTARATDDIGQTSTDSVTLEVDQEFSGSEKGIIYSCDEDTSGDGFCLSDRNTSETFDSGFTNDDNVTLSATVDVINSAVGTFELFGFANATGVHNELAESEKVNVTVEDASEEESSNEAPTAEYTITPTDPTPGETINFDASGSSDPDGNIESYEWDWTNDGEIDDTGETATHSYSSEGDYTARLVVTDDEGATSTYTNTVPVVEEDDDGDGDNGGNVGGGDDDTSEPNASIDGSSVQLLAPYSGAKYSSDVYNFDEGETRTIVIVDEEQTISVNNVIDSETASLNVNGLNNTFSEGEFILSEPSSSNPWLDTSDTSLPYVSSIVNHEDSKVVSISTFETGIVSGSDAYMAYNYTLDGSGSVDILVKETEEDSFSVADSVSSNDSVENTFRSVIEEYDNGVYQVKARLNAGGDTAETRTIGFYAGNVPVIDILRPEDGLNLVRPVGQTNVSVPLDFRFQNRHNNSVNVSTYYERSSDGERFIGNLEEREVVRQPSDSVIVRFFRNVGNFLFSWTDRVQFGGRTEVIQNSSVPLQGSGDFIGSVKLTGNGVNTSSIPRTVSIDRLDLRNETERTEYFDQRDGDTEQSYVESPTLNETLGENSTISYYSAQMAVFSPNPDEELRTSLLEEFKPVFDFDIVVNSTGIVNRSLIVEEVNGSTKAEVKLDPYKTQYSKTINSSMFSNGWEQGTYNITGRTYYENGTVLQSLDPNHQFTVKETSIEQGLISYVFGSVVDAILTVYDFTSERAKLIVASVVSFGWYLGFKARNQDVLARYGLAGWFILFSWIEYVPDDIQALVMVALAAVIVVKGLRGDVSL